jgi:NAD(P)H-dependent FMN reductase/ketosteroid isomerase-like protein
MESSTSVAVIVGSLRRDSYSRKVAHALMERAPESVQCRLIEIADLPLYNEDLDDRPPASWKRFREEVRACQAVLFVTPEYNRSMPGCLKNALDVGSRPQNESVWNGLPVGVVSVTPYKLGAFGANHALRQTFVYLNMLVMQQPEAYIGGAADLFNDDGTVKNPDTHKLFTDFMSKLAHWTATVCGTDTAGTFHRFLQNRKQAALAYISGDAGPLDAMLTRVDPATFFDAQGGQILGAEAVKARYDADAQVFGKGGAGELEILQSGSCGELAFWTGVQHAEVHLRGKHASMTLRVTEVFRFEDGGWKLTHRHADVPAQ